MNKTQQILKYKEANPTHKPSDIAKACGVKNTYVYQVLNNAKKKAKKDLKPVAPTEGQLTLRKEIDRLNKEIEEWRSMFYDNLEALGQLEQDVIGYRAVISYLQGQIDGVTV
jgi:hypothetical protein